MAIQFTCPACSQPIEIDDQYAGQQVVCPYCQGVVAAPAESQPAMAAKQTAAPVAEQPAVPAGGPPPATMPTPPPAPPGWAQPPVPLATNRPGNWSLVAALLAWALFVAYVCYTAVVMLALLPPGALDAAADDAKAGVEFQRHLQEAMKRFADDPALATKRSVVTALGVFSSALGLVGVVLAVVGLTRKQAKKGTSIAGLVVSAPLLLCMLFALLAGIVQAAGAG